MGVFYSNAGYVLYQLNDLDRAQEYIDKANRCFVESGAILGRSRVYCYAALLANKRGNSKEAQKYLTIAQEIARRGGNPSSQSLVDEVYQLLNG